MEDLEWYDEYCPLTNKIIKKAHFKVAVNFTFDDKPITNKEFFSLIPDENLKLFMESSLKEENYEQAAIVKAEIDKRKANGKTLD